MDRFIWVDERPPFVPDLLTGLITKLGRFSGGCGKGQVVFGDNHVSSQPMRLTKCLVSSSTDYDASGRGLNCSDQATFPGDREEYDGRGRSRDPANYPAGFGTQRHGGLSLDIPNGGPWDNHSPWGYSAEPTHFYFN